MAQQKKRPASAIWEYIAAACLLSGAVITVITIMADKLMWLGPCFLGGFLICVFAMAVCRKRERNKLSNPYQKRRK